MINKILLYFKIRKFYHIFAQEVGYCFINKLSDMTKDNVYDVLFDLNEVNDVDETKDWLTELQHQIYNFCEKKYPLENTVLYHISNINFEVCYAICFDKKTGEVKPHTKHLYNFFKWIHEQTKPYLFKRFSQLYPNGQATLDEIRFFYLDYTIYSIGNKDLIYVVDKKGCVIKCFESIGYEDDDCVPDVYEVFTDDLKQQFSYVQDCYIETHGNIVITKIQG